MWLKLKNILLAPIYRRRLRLVFEQPHHFYLLNELFGACATQADKEGLESLSEPQKTLLHIWHAGGIIGNGGFRYFFECGLDGPATARAYDVAGLPKKAAAVRKAIEFFPDAHPSKNFDERIAQLAAIEREHNEKFEGLSHIMWDEEHETKARLAAYVRAQRQAFNGRYLPDRKAGGWYREVTPPRPDASPREVAEWILRIHSWVHVKQAGASKDVFVSELDNLPREAFNITGARLCSSRSTTDRDLAAMTRLKALDHLERLDLAGSTLGRPGLACIAHWAELRRLELERTSLASDDLAALGSLPRLEKLGLPRTIDETGLVHICRHTALKDIGGLAVSDAGLPYLKSLQAIEELSFYEAKISDAGLVHLGEMASLRRLTLRHMPLTDSGVFHLRNLTKLEDLYLGSLLITGKALEYVGEFPRLKSLSLECCPVGDDGLLHLRKLVEMERLDLYATQVGDRGLEGLAGMVKLDYLSLGSTHVSGEGVAYLGGLVRLRELYLRQIPLTDTGAKSLEPLTGLEILWLDDTNVTDEGLSGLRRLSRLSHLCLNDTGIRGPGLVHLTELPALKDLDLASTPLGNDALPYFQKMTSLRELDLSGTRVDNGGLPVLKTLSQLTSLDLRRSLIEEAAIKELQAALPSCQVSTF